MRQAFPDGPRGREERFNRASGNLPRRAIRIACSESAGSPNTRHQLRWLTPVSTHDGIDTRSRAELYTFENLSWR